MPEGFDGVVDRHAAHVVDDSGENLVLAADGQRDSAFVARCAEQHRAFRYMRALPLPRGCG